MLLYIFAQIKGADLATLASLYKEPAMQLIGVGFVFAGLSVLKKALNRVDQVRSDLISYIVALVVYIIIWALI